jgi:cytochrome c
VKPKTLFAIGFVIFCGAGFVHPFGRVRSANSAGPLLAGASVPAPVMGIFLRSCQNCHSEKTAWPVYSYVAPMSWMIERDVSEARAHMNLSRWAEYDSERRREILTEMGSLVRNYQMPPGRYLLLHPDARLSDADVKLLYEWARSERKRVGKMEVLPSDVSPTVHQ